MPSSKGIQRRIKSVSNTKKVTRAMEMVAAAKMRRVIDVVLKSRKYSHISWELIQNLINNMDCRHPLISSGKNIDSNKKNLVILFTANRGLCGGFNSNIVNHVLKFAARKEKAHTDFVLTGRRGGGIYKADYKVIAEFPKPDIAFRASEIIPLVKLAIESYKSGEYKKIFVAYNHFVNSIKSTPFIRQILPVNIFDKHNIDKDLKEDELRHLAYHSPVDLNLKKPFNESVAKAEYTFEPNTQAVLDSMIPRFLEAQIFQALLESNASEQSARMAAMRQATDAAGDMINELTLNYNKARQGGITQEISEIVAGVNAMA